MFDFDDAFRLVAKQTVLCIGDLMLDDFVYGEVTRISPEAPAPALAVRNSHLALGVRGNLPHNLPSLRPHTLFFGGHCDGHAISQIDRRPRAEPLRSAPLL